MTDAKPQPIPLRHPAPKGAKTMLQQFFDAEGNTVRKPVPGGHMSIMYYRANGDLLETVHADVIPEALAP